MKHIPTVKVGILKSKTIRFELSGDFTQHNSNKIVSGSFVAELQKGAISIAHNDITAIYEQDILFSSLNIEQQYFEVEDVLIGIDFHWEQLKKQQFQGDLKLIVVGDYLQLINIVPVENYLQSVISSEMSANSSSELLKSHTIISRSWLIAQLNNKSKSSENNGMINTDTEIIRWYDKDDHNLYDVCADDHCQRYQGISKTIRPAVTEAVAATCGQVLMYDNNICDARYSKCCGGATELFENCWENTPLPYLQKITDTKEQASSMTQNLEIETNAASFISNRPPAFCNTNKKEVLTQVLNDYDQSTTDFYRWKTTYTQKELSSILLDKSGIDFGEIINIKAIERGASGRIIRLQIVGTKQSITVGKELEIRRWLSKTHLYSSAFIVEYSEYKDNIPNKIILKGAGWGHGVGLCQIGAAVMGEEGYNYKEILAHYFKGASLTKQY